MNYISKLILNYLIKKKKKNDCPYEPLSRQNPLIALLSRDQRACCKIALRRK